MSPFLSLMYSSEGRGGDMGDTVGLAASLSQPADWILSHSVLLTPF